MVNGKPGDDPIFDILEHNIEVYNKETDDLIRRLSELMPRYRLNEWFDKEKLQRAPASEVFEKVKKKIEEIEKEGKERGWEI